MTRMLLTLIVLVAVLGLLLIMKYAKDSYLLLPASKSELTEPVLANYQDWHEYRPSDGSYKALFPFEPQHVSENSLDPKTKIKRKYDTYLSANKDGTIYMVSEITYPDRIEATEAADALLSNIMNEMISSKAENQLKSTQKGMFKGNNALDFSIENDQYEYQVKAFAKDKTLFVLSAISRKGENNSKNFDFFVNSFSLNEDEIPKALK